MWVNIDLCLIPIGVGVSISPFVAACKKVIEKYELVYELGPNGTAIEGEWDNVFDCVKECHEQLHQLGVVRVFTTLKVNTRTDRKQLFHEKVSSVISSIK